MGNSPSSKRPSASSRELERFSQPTGLYASCPWDVKVARRLVVERKIAPRFPGRDAPESAFSQECPICFMYYPGNLNVSTCCSKPICSECYLQMRPPHQPISCPFCNSDGFTVKYSPPASLELNAIFSNKKRTNSRATSRAIDIPAPATTNNETESESVAHYASVEDRQRLRDSLRSQLSITDQPITNSPHPNSLASLRDAAQFLATPADAVRLEELMIMEAIRRSMRDLNANKENEDGASASPSSPSGSAGLGLQRNQLNESHSRTSSADYDGDVHSVQASELFRSESGIGVDNVASHRNSASSGGNSSGRDSQGNSDNRRGSLSNWSPFDD